MEEIRQKVLIVDDNPKNISVLEDTLEPLGYELFVSLNANKALDIIPVINPDLILLDIMMPDLNGFDMCRILKKDPKTAGIPIIFLTAIDSVESKVKAFKMGAADYICKPFNCLEVTARVNIHLQKALAFKKLEELNRILDHRVMDEFSKRMKQEQMLMQQSKMAAMGEMIGVIAHQWKQPLNSLGLVVQNFGEMAGANSMSAEQADHAVEKMMSIINHMSKTVDDFRDFFKPNKEKKAFPVVSAIEDVFMLISAQLKNEDIVVKIVDNSNGAMALGYKNEFKQAVLNIVSNAKDAIIGHKNKNLSQNFNGEIFVLIDAKNYSGNKKLEIKIVDNGGGIDEKIIDRIFDPYFTTKCDDTGTGIGLHMSKIIIEESMGGLISVNNFSNGAQFTIVLNEA